ncbi:hypothetical protein [Haloarcula sediminis]|uniref:hypothetical protein n=1 Tax=Haloarcula sediminis TaxID=3111777 RepID=UPI002D77DA57|nr:hypothetical protein [Haloarcula sp. CK38]
MSRLSTTFSSWSDRITYIVAEAQLLVAGLLVSLAIALIWIRPSVPGVPPIFMGWFAAFLLLGPPTFGFFVWLIRKLRNRNMVEVHHVNGLSDEIEKYYVEPELWREKKVDGANPYPVNGGSAWAVQEFEEDEEMQGIRVKGVWLEETEDTKLLTSKSHMEAIYGKLTESHIALGILRDSVSEYGADIQKRLINSMAEAREKGKMMDESAVKDVFSDFEENAKGHGPDDLPTLEPEEDGADPRAPDPEPEGPAQNVAEAAGASASEVAATDGGTEE